MIINYLFIAEDALDSPNNGSAGACDDTPK